MKGTCITSAADATNQSPVEEGLSRGTAVGLDLRGVRCPLSWAKAKVRLEILADGDLLQLLIDEEKGARDIPRAAEAEGYAVLSLTPETFGWSLIIQK